MRNHRSCRNTNDAGDGTSWRGRRNYWSRRKMFVFPKIVESTSGFGICLVSCYVTIMQWKRGEIEDLPVQ